MSIVPATPEIAAAYYGGMPAFTFKGWACLKDGEPIGLCGISWRQGYPVAFSEFKEPLRGHRKIMAKGVRIAVALMNEIKGPVYAIEGIEHPTAPALLRKLGFVPTGEEMDGCPVYVREPQ